MSPSSRGWNAGPRGLQGKAAAEPARLLLPLFAAALGRIGAGAENKSARWTERSQKT
jgi:hypothetical protein